MRINQIRVPARVPHRPPREKVWLAQAKSISWREPETEIWRSSTRDVKANRRSLPRADHVKQSRIRTTTRAAKPGDKNLVPLRV